MEFLLRTVARMASAGYPPAMSPAAMGTVHGAGAEECYMFGHLRSLLSASFVSRGACRPHHRVCYLAYSPAIISHLRPTGEGVGACARVKWGREPACTWFLGLHPESTPRASEEACAHEVLCAGLWGRGLPQPAGC